jgi:hypothetical protein
MLHWTPGRGMAGALVVMAIATATAVAIIETRDRVSTTPRVGSVLEQRDGTLSLMALAASSDSKMTIANPESSFRV